MAGRRLYSKLALKVSLTAAVAVAVLAVVLAGTAWAFPWPAAALAAAVAATVTYAVVAAMLTARIELARSTLQEIRKHRFDALQATRAGQGDELNDLVWEVYRTGLALEKEIRELKRVENYRREFLGNVSHELKTPIFAVQGYAETLLNGGLEDERHRRRFVEKILHNAGRLGHLANDLTEISRMETGEMEMEVASFDLLQLAREVVEALESTAAAKDVQLRCQVPEGLPPGMGDRERIRQVLINLADNAIKYNNTGGHVEVGARLLPSGDLKVSVVDDGIGVAPEHIPRLTERFYRVDKSRSRVQGGTGLGLAIVKHILAAHDRQLVIESSPGRGSTFGFTLATAPEPAASSGRPAAVQQARA